MLALSLARKCQLPPASVDYHPPKYPLPPQTLTTPHKCWLPPASANYPRQVSTPLRKNHLPSASVDYPPQMLTTLYKCWLPPQISTTPKSAKYPPSVNYPLQVLSTPQEC